MVVNGGVLVEIVHGGSTLEGRSLSCEKEVTRKREEGSERGERRKKRKRGRWNKKIIFSLTLLL